MSVTATTSQRTLFVRDLNIYLVCSLCEGYFREAHTVPDCLHTFCKCCLFKEFAKKGFKDVKECPTCKISLGLRPYDKVVYDRNLQALVDKIFPHFAEQDKIVEEQFYASCEADEASNSNNNRPLLMPQPSLKRALPVESNRSYPNKMPTQGDSNGERSNSSHYSTSENNKSNTSSNSSGKGAFSTGIEVDFQGLTLRVVPFDSSLISPSPSSSTGPSTGSSTSTQSYLPSLTKPLLRVSSRTVNVEKIQRYIHKRMGAPSSFAPDDIEILRDGVIQDSTSAISHLPPLAPGTDMVLLPQQPSLVTGENVIVLAYRKKSATPKQLPLSS